MPAGAGLVFCTSDGLRFGVEICEDMWAVVPPSLNLAQGGAHAIFNLSAESELVAKGSYRRDLVKGLSAGISGAYILAGAGVHESTTDSVFGGHALIAVNGTIREENKRFSRESSIIFSDFRAEWTDNLRASWSSFNDGAVCGRNKTRADKSVKRVADCKYIKISGYPFVPEADAGRSERCHEIFEIQSTGLAKRIEHTQAKRLVIGLSGGLDSTLALLVAVWTCDKLSLPRSMICAITMPGFGTTERTKTNAEKLAKKLGVELRTIDIRNAVETHFRDIDHDPENRNVVYENSQARERTQILMDISNSESGILIGTGDLSEIALGWSTFNGDHMQCTM